MAQDYNQTLNLPKTDFSMKAGLVTKEPIAIEKWETEELYKKILKKNEGKPSFVLHDGPPYANGDIHLGTALNKTLKDIIIRYKNMNGYYAPYVPGWDTHGLPIELKAIKKAGIQESVNLTPVELRKICKDYALSFVDNQRNQFKRLGVLGEWDNPYLTLKAEFEAAQIEVFGEMANKGSIYKGLKPVYWCPECKTALAEAEIEYIDAPCYSIYVSFKVTEDFGKLEALGADLTKTYFVIWTTTTWTLPGNLAICVGPEYSYALIKSGDKFYVMAEDLTDSAMADAGITDYEIIGTIKGSELEYMKTAHPFIDRDSLVIVGDHVTLESGTGCVHTAPGHGVEDFEVCRNYEGLDPIVPVDDKGCLNSLAGADLEGKPTEEANKIIAQKLEDCGALFAIKKIVHQYPHCWRCKNPIIFRATEQWFCSIDAFKEKAVEEIKKVDWIPAWGEDRITSMVRERSDWCISRQRTWGVPIPIFYCEKCGKEHYNPATIKKIAEVFRTEGSDAWYTKSAAELMPEGEKCAECGNTTFTKETDIMDVWFDSGVTHQAVCANRDYLKYPADLYLEGADQYRGWFQSSLLTSVAAKGIAPYKQIVTHGWVVDGEGRKMSKSLGNGIVPNDIIKQNGADILRLWVASSDYQVDIRVSKDLLKQLSEIYRKIRNTARFILGNISDFDPV
jgi:isoleucyl-tRNA synthetase